jgi:hypothetical protein
MSCFYAMWDIIDGKQLHNRPASKAYPHVMCVDTIARKLNSSDASEYAEMIGFFGPRVWGKLQKIAGVF